MIPTAYRNFNFLLARVGDRYRAFVVDAPASAWLRDILNYPMPNPTIRRHP